VNVFNRNNRPAPSSNSGEVNSNGIGSVNNLNRNNRPAPPSKSSEENSTQTQRHQLDDDFQPQHSTRANIKIW
jgi:hypothetical protein